MRKITLLLALLVCSFGFAQQLATSPTTEVIQAQNRTSSAEITEQIEVQVPIGINSVSEYKAAEQAGTLQMTTVTRTVQTGVVRRTSNTSSTRQPSTFYADRASFQAACSGTLNFEDLAGGPGAIMGCTESFSDLGNTCYAAAEIETGVVIDAFTNSGGDENAFFPAGSQANTDDMVGSNFFDDFTHITFPNNDVDSFGFDLYTLFGAVNVDIRVMGAGGLIDTYTVASPGSGTGSVFVGVIADETITSVEIEDLSLGNAEFVSQIEFGMCGGGASDTWEVTVEDTVNFGDEVTWELRDNGGAVILSGGPYGTPPYTDTQSVTTSNEPLEFFIQSMGPFNDNTPIYTVSCSGTVIVTGQLAGGTDATESGLVCGGGGGGGMCNINYANVIPGISGSPSQIFPDFGGAQGISADDFVIPLLPSQAAAICDITVAGVYSGAGVAADPNSMMILNIYTDAAGTPDSLIFSESFDGVTTDPGNTGSFTLTPTGTINLMGGTTYYASVVVSMEFGLAGQWFWLSATDFNDGEMQWEDTDNLFGTGCTTWMPGSACGINGGDPDLQMDINFMQVPTFDECLGAIPMLCGDVVTGDTTTNTDTGGFNGAPDAWYSYTGTGAQEFVTFSLCDGGTTYDSRLTVYDMCGAVELATNDDFCGLQSELGFLSDGTTTYYVAIEGFNAGSAGPYSLELTCNPVAANDACANAEAINCGDVVAGSTNFATLDPAAPDCGVGITAPGVWYTFSDATGLLTDYSVDLCDGGTAYDSKLTVYVGDDCGTLTCIGDNDDDCGLQSAVSWQSGDVATYYVLVHGFGGGTGDFSLTLSCEGVPPPNDMIANSIDVDEIGYPYTDPNVSMPFATTEAGSPVDCDNAGALGVWYNFVPAGNGSATASITTPAGPSSVTFYTAPSESAVETDLVHVDYFLNQCVDGTEATILTAAGQAYYVYVYNHGGATDIVIDGIGLGTDENIIEGFGFFPNPAKDMLTLNSADTIESVEIFSIVGQQVMNQAINATSTDLNVSALSTGTYLMKVIVNGQTGVYKVIKE